MDHKWEIRCLNNDCLLYLANVKKGKCNSSVTQHEKVNGSELEIGFPRKKRELSYILSQYKEADAGSKFGLQGAS